MSRGHYRSLLSLVLLLAGAAIAFVFFTVPVIAETSAEAHTNRLIHSASPYLLENAHNPVDWYPWGVALAVARPNLRAGVTHEGGGVIFRYWRS